MAKLDQFIEALHKRNASRLIVAAGEPASLRFGDELRPVTSQPFKPELLRTLVAEIAPPDAHARLVSNGEVSFSYAAPSGAVSVVASGDGESARLEIVPDSPPSYTEEASGPQGNVVPFPSSSRRRAVDESGIVVSGPSTKGMDTLFTEMFEKGCSDLHLTAGNPPLFRKDGSIVTLSATEPLAAETVYTLLMSITPAAHRREFEETGDVDFSYEVPAIARYRCNLFRDRNGPGGVFRVIPNMTPTAEALGLSSHILKLCQLSKGLVLVTGPTGSGKSTTLAAMVDYINRNRSDHVITIEDPIEFVHPNKKCLINQREVGNHTQGFKKALRAALREDPDIVLVGEMRDLETVEIAIETAETGHLVFGTLHTNTAASTVDRIIDQFPPDRQNQIRSMLASSLKGVIAQTLCKRKEGGRCAALEVLIVNAAVSNLIREGKTFQIGSIMQTGAKMGMSTLNDALMTLVKSGAVEAEEALRKAVDRQEFVNLLERNGVRVDFGIGQE